MVTFLITAVAVIFSALCLFAAYVNVLFEMSAKPWLFWSAMSAGLAAWGVYDMLH